MHTLWFRKAFLVLKLRDFMKWQERHEKGSGRFLILAKWLNAWPTDTLCMRR
jgi:hypothetical protein